MGRTVESQTVIDCEGCGKLVRHSNQTAEPFPDGWFILQYTYKTHIHQAEFCSPECLVGWINVPVKDHMKAAVPKNNTK